MSGPSRPPARMGLESPAPVFAARNLDAAMAFYDRLGFTVRRYDSGYGYAGRVCAFTCAPAPRSSHFRTTPRSTSRRRRWTSCTRSGEHAACLLFDRASHPH